MHCAAVARLSLESQSDGGIVKRKLNLPWILFGVTVVDVVGVAVTVVSANSVVTTTSDDTCLITLSLGFGFTFAGLTPAHKHAIAYC